MKDILIAIGWLIVGFFAGSIWTFITMINM
jgi:hypothetical protein